MRRWPRAIDHLAPLLTFLLLSELLLKHLLCWPALFALVDPFGDEFGRVELDVEARDRSVGRSIKDATILLFRYAFRSVALVISRFGRVWVVIVLVRVVAVRVSVLCVLLDGGRLRGRSLGSPLLLAHTTLLFALLGDVHRIVLLELLDAALGIDKVAVRLVEHESELRVGAKGASVGFRRWLCGRRRRVRIDIVTAERAAEAVRHRMRGSARIVVAGCSRSVSRVARLSMLRKGTSTTLPIAAGTSAPAAAAAAMRSSASLTAGHLSCKERQGWGVRKLWWEKRKGEDEAQVLWSSARITTLPKNRGSKKVRLGKRCLRCGSSDSRENFKRPRSRAKWRHIGRLRRCELLRWRERPSELEPGCSP